ncbi:hypothetical protein K3495_g5422 [Podosphaera aphanis]|nr:hypothetical protein K3495_g5422 [Podosphaera aphanis]
MAPFITTFPVDDLHVHIKKNEKGKLRKGFHGQLEKGELLEMLQYECAVKGEKVICQPVERFFRRLNCANGSFMVETTSWEKKSTSN